MATVLAALEEHLEAAGTAEAEAPVRSGHRYLSNRLDGLDYPLPSPFEAEREKRSRGSRGSRFPLRLPPSSDFGAAGRVFALNGVLIERTSGI